MVNRLEWLGIRNGCLSVAMYFAAAISAGAAETVTVTEISGQKAKGTLVAWSETQVAISVDKPLEIARSKIRSITFERPAKEGLDSGPMIWLSNGDRIAARATSVKDEGLTITWSALETALPKPIPLELVTALFMELPESVDERNRLYADIDSSPPGNDIIMLINGDRTDGSFQELDSSFAKLETKSGVLQLDRSRVRAVRMNPELISAPKPLDRRAVLTLVDGSRISASSVEVVKDLIAIKSPTLGAISVSGAKVASCEFFGGLVVPITDREPSKVDFTPFLSRIWKPVRNANCLHGPLSIRGTEYPSGLGVHSRMAVSYDLKGSEAFFQSVVGIDDAANGKGSVTFAVEVDEKRVWVSEETTGRSPVVTTPMIPLKGGKTIRLIVEFGQFADSSDYANWADALFILASE